MVSTLALTIYYLPFTTYHLLLTIYYLPFTTYHLLLTIYANHLCHFYLIFLLGHTLPLFGNRVSNLALETAFCGGHRDALGEQVAWGSLI